jgi:hypothetical protein
MARTLPEKLAIPLNRGIPADYIQFIEPVVTVCPRAPLIFNVLNEIAKKKHAEVSWTREDIVEFCRVRTNSSNVSDAGTLIRQLKARSGLQYNHRLDSEGCLELVIAELEGARELVRKAGTSLCVMYDTTFGTNIHDCKLGLFTTVNESYGTSILAISLLSGDECKDKFSWIFTEFVKMFEVRPSVIITDSCAKIGAAVQEVLHDTRHLLCVWHIFLNFEKHVYNIVSREDWRTINNKFWLLAKETDARSAEKEPIEQTEATESALPTFADEYKALVNAVKESAVHRLGNEAHPKLQNALRWLNETLFKKREKWAYRYTWSIFTGGCHSTQRAEAIHAAIKV